MLGELGDLVHYLRNVLHPWLSGMVHNARLTLLFILPIRHSNVVNHADGWGTKCLTFFDPLMWV